MFYFIKDDIIKKQDNLNRDLDLILTDLLEEYISKIERFNFVDKPLKRKILNAATASNKLEIMENLDKQVALFKSYETKESEKFPYKTFVKNFIE